MRYRFSNNQAEETFIGKKYSELIILKFLYIEDKHNRPHVECLCSCGQITKCILTNLRNGYSKRCRDCKNSLKSLGLVNTGLRRLYNRYKVSAKVRELDFTISFDVFKDTTGHNCFYCGKVPSMLAKAHNKALSNNVGNILYNGLDRVDNTKGYVYSNVVACCKNCNLAKRDLSSKDFIDWINSVYLYQKEVK